MTEIATGRSADTNPEPHTLADVFRLRAAEGPERIAIRIPKRRWWGKGWRVYEKSYGALDILIRRLESGLSRGGIGPGDRVLVLEPVSPRLYAVLLALAGLGATAILPDPTALLGSIRAACRSLTPRALIGPAKAQVLRLICAELRAIPRAFSLEAWVPATRSALGPLHEIPAAPSPLAPEVPALITFSSGTTGAPKGIPRSQNSLLAQNQALQPLLAAKPGEPVLSTLPVFVLAVLAAGAVAVLPRFSCRHPSSAMGRAFLAQLQEESIVHAIASPSLSQALAAAILSQPGPDPSSSSQACRSDPLLPSLRQFFTGGAPVRPILLQSLSMALPQTHIKGVYGASEAEPIAVLEAGALSAADCRRWYKGGD